MLVQYKLCSSARQGRNVRPTSYCTWPVHMQAAATALPRSHISTRVQWAQKVFRPLWTSPCSGPLNNSASYGPCPSGSPALFRPASADEESRPTLSSFPCCPASFHVLISIWSVFSSSSLDTHQLVVSKVPFWIPYFNGWPSGYLIIRTTCVITWATQFRSIWVAIFFYCEETHPPFQSIVGVLQRTASVSKLNVYKIGKSWTCYNIVGIGHYRLILHQQVQYPLSAIQFDSRLTSSD